MSLPHMGLLLQSFYALPTAQLHSQAKSRLGHTQEMKPGGRLGNLQLPAAQHSHWPGELF